VVVAVEGAAGLRGEEEEEPAAEADLAGEPPSMWVAKGLRSASAMVACGGLGGLALLLACREGKARVFCAMCVGVH